MKLSVKQELRVVCSAVDDSIRKFYVKHLVIVYSQWWNLLQRMCGIVGIKSCLRYMVKSLPRQICIIVAITNAIITGVDRRTGREGE